MPLKELDAAPELRDNPSLKDFNDVSSLAKSFVEQKAFVGNSLRPPGPGASDAERQDFYKKLTTHAPHLVPVVEGDAEAEKVLWGKLGRPDKPEGYDFKPPAGVEVDLEGLRTAAVAGGLTKKQFEALAAKTVAGVQAQSATQQKEVDALFTEWGTAKESKLKAAAALALKSGQSETVAGRILAGKMSAQQLKTWDFFATAIGSESKEIAGQGGNKGGEGMTRDEAQRQFAEIQRNPAYFNASAPDHQQLVDRALALQGLLNPG